MGSVTHRSVSLGFLALGFVLQACSSSESAKDASLDGRDGTASPGLDGDHATSEVSAPDQASAGADSVGVDSVLAVEVSSGEVPYADATLADGGSTSAPIPLDGRLDEVGADASPSGQSDLSVDGGPALDGSAFDGGEGNSTEVGGVDFGSFESGEVFTDDFSCDTPVSPDAGISRRLCYDFSNPASAADFVPEAGNWSVAGGFYTAIGPSDQVTCPAGGGTVMIASVLAGLSAQNVRVHAKMTSVVGPDKLLVLRSHAGGNRIEINFRANYVDGGQTLGGDLNVADLVDCVDAGDYISAGGPNPILIPHSVGQAIVVDVQLIGQQLTVAVDGRVVFDGNLPLSTAPGSVGFAVFRDSAVLFDNLLVDVLD